MNRLIKSFTAVLGFLSLVFLLANCNSSKENKQNIDENSENVKPKILFVVTSHDKMGDTGEKTGYYLGEVSHAWEVLTEAGYEIDFVRPKGGNPPVDAFDLEDAVNKKFWEDSYYQNKLSNSLMPSQVNPEEYKAIYYAGGHGTMWDFPNDEDLAKIAAKIYENKGIVAAVCHGPAALVNLKLSDGSYLIEGKKVNALTNKEEVLVKLAEVVPLLLEDKLIERGAIFEKSEPWQSHVSVDQRFITGQNPQSAKAVGEAILKELK